MRVEDIRQRLRTLGALPVHEERILRKWARGQAQMSGRRKMDNFLPKPLLNALPGIEADLNKLLRVQSEHPGADGSSRLLVALDGGQSIETVLLPREGVCVSSQVGCAVGCVFCMTGRSGLLRQVGSAEMVAQVVLARQRRPVRKVVFMGMGEPAHNLDNVLEAIEVLGTLGGIGHKNLVFSTVGDLRVFERLPLGVVKPALALSLHTTQAALRAKLLPRAPHIDPAELVTMAEAYARRTGYPIQYQWTLISGVNDGDDELDAIVQLLRGKYALMNMIPFNAIEGTDFQRPTDERCAAIARSLNQRGVLTKLRQSAGQDVDAGCGQLRARQSPLAMPLRSAAGR